MSGTLIGSFNDNLGDILDESLDGSFNDNLGDILDKSLDGGFSGSFMAVSVAVLVALSIVVRLGQIEWHFGWQFNDNLGDILDESLDGTFGGSLGSTFNRNSREVKQ